MDTNINGALDNFLNTEKENLLKQSIQPEIKLAVKEGLIERVDKIYIVGDGRQLLREQY